MIIIFIVIFGLSLVLSWRSMADYEPPKAIKNFFSIKKIQGTLVFFKDRIKHYQSSKLN